MVDREHVEALQERVEELIKRLKSGEAEDNPVTSALAAEVMRIAADVLKLRTELVFRQVEEDPMAAGQLALLTRAVAVNANEFSEVAAALAVAQALHAAERN